MPKEEAKHNTSSKMIFCDVHKIYHQMKNLDLSKIHKLCIDHGHCIVGPSSCPLSHTCLS